MYIFLGVRLSIHEPVPHSPSKYKFARALVTVLSHFKTIHWSNHLVNLRPVLLEIDGRWLSFSRIYCMYHDTFIPPRSWISSKCSLPPTWSFQDLGSSLIEIKTCFNLVQIILIIGPVGFNFVFLMTLKILKINPLKIFIAMSNKINAYLIMSFKISFDTNLSMFIK